MTKVEIGSEFHSMSYGHGSGIRLPEQVVDYVFTFSGRTAIETVLKNEEGIKKVLLPSYCCDSMIEPFRRAKIDVGFYPVYYDNDFKIDIEIQNDIDCVLWCNYFGYNQQMPDFKTFIERGGIVIEDITHSFFSERQFHQQSSYLAASLRKWEPVNCGGYCAGVAGQLRFKPLQEPPDSFVCEKRQMMEIKKDYLNDIGSVQKEQFLAGFANNNSWLADHYSGLKIDPASENYLHLIDQQAERIQRIRNAKRLYHGIRTGDTIAFLFRENEMDCPLFVPIMVFNGKRDVLRKKLIDHNVYCPIHWPHPKADCESNLFDMELSLVCDQRYRESDMDYIISVINDCSNI